VVDLSGSLSYRKAHVPGARWSIRPRLAAHTRNPTGAIVLVSDDADAARLAAIDLAEAGLGNVKLLEGGTPAWVAAGYATEASPAVPADRDCIDHLFFVHDRHAGNRDAMRQYLAWETGLLAQLDRQDRAAFRIPAA
jgi:hypothetical protein